MKRNIEVVRPDSFEQEHHFYPKALNSQLHAMVSHFFNLDHERIIKRYKHLNPQVDADVLRSILKYQSKHFFWGGLRPVLCHNREWQSQNGCIGNKFMSFRSKVNAAQE